MNNWLHQQAKRPDCLLAGFSIAGSFQNLANGGDNFTVANAEIDADGMMGTESSESSASIPLQKAWKDIENLTLIYKISIPNMPDYPTAPQTTLVGPLGKQPIDAYIHRAGSSWRIYQFFRWGRGTSGIYHWIVVAGAGGTFVCAAVKNGKACSVYKEGIQSGATQTFGGDTLYNLPALITFSAPPQSTFPLKMHYCYLFDKAMSQDEIKCFK